MLHAVDQDMDKTGTWGAEYMAYRLLYTNLPVIARWDRLRQIAARLARDDEDSKNTYPLYLQKLCDWAAQNGGPSLAVCCSGDLDSYGLCGGRYCDYDLVAAAAYLGKISIIDHVANNAHTLRIALGLFGCPFMSAVAGGNLEAMQLLFQKVALVHDSWGAANTLRCRLLSRISVRGSTAIVQAALPHYEPDRYEDDNENERSLVMKDLDNALRTQNVETFELLKRIKEETPHPKVDEEHWKKLLEHACRRGSADMVQHLLTLGLQHSYELKESSKLRHLITLVCLRRGTSDSDRTVRTLLSHGVPVTSDALAGAAKLGNWNLVQILVEAGTDVNIGDPKPLVSAIAQERTDMFKALLGWGARLDGETMKACAERAKEEGLESMLDLLHCRI
jgi:hypothetical protein